VSRWALPLSGRKSARGAECHQKKASRAYAQNARQKLEAGRQVARSFAIDLQGDFRFAVGGRDLHASAPRALDFLHGQMMAAVETVNVGHDPTRPRLPTVTRSKRPSSSTASGQIFMPPPKKRPLPTAARSRLMRRSG